MKISRQVVYVAAILMAAVLATARADTYTIDGDQQIDGNGVAATIALTSGTNVVSADDGTQWVFDFSTLDPAMSLLNLASNKLFSASNTVETIALDLAGADLSGTNTVAIDTGAGSAADHIKILNVRDIAMGGIQTVPNSAAGRSIQIGAEATPANLVQVAYLYTYGGPNEQYASGGSVTIYSTNDVTIADSEGNAGDILTHNHDDGLYGGDVKIVHRGDFLANSIKSHITRDYGGGDEWPGDIELDGGDSSGDMTALGQIRVSQENRGESFIKPLIGIDNYANVSIGGDIVGYCRLSWAYATDVVVTNNISGNITLSGEIDLENRATTDKDHYGRLNLKAGDTITLANLNLDLVGYAALSSGNGSTIEGDLIAFDTDNSSGVGIVSDPFITSQDTLRAPAGEFIYYTMEDGKNVYLGGYAYRVADMDGNPGAGGILSLAPEQPGIATRDVQSLEQTSATLTGTLTATGKSATAVSVYWKEGPDAGATETGWTDSYQWAEHTDTLPYEYTHSITVDPGKEYTYRFVASNDWGVTWGQAETFITPWTGDRLTLDGDQQMDSGGEMLLFEEIDAPLRREGEWVAGVEVSPWLYDFGVVYIGTGMTVDLSTNKLYIARASGSRETINLNLNGADLVGASTNAPSIDMTRNSSPDVLAITNVGAVNIGGIDARGLESKYNSDSVMIGQENAPAGNIRIAYLLANGVSGDEAGGNVTIYGSNDVIIADADGNAGDFLTHANGNAMGGHVTITHQGTFLVNNLDSRCTSVYGKGDWHPGDIELDGGDSSGDMTVLDQLRVSQETRAEASVPFIGISNYNNVSIGSNIVGYCRVDFAYATDVVVTNNISGDITVGGEIDLENRATTNPDHFGRLMLKAGGTITLAELDLGKVQYAYLSSGNDPSVITGVVSNFNTTVDSGTGTEADPYVTAETRLRVPANETIYYTYEDGGLNDYLGGHAWQLKDLDGTTEGGVLMTEPPSGTVILIR